MDMDDANSNGRDGHRRDGGLTQTVWSTLICVLLILYSKHLDRQAQANARKKTIYKKEGMNIVFYINRDEARSWPNEIRKRFANVTKAHTPYVTFQNVF